MSTMPAAAMGRAFTDRYPSAGRRALIELPDGRLAIPLTDAEAHTARVAAGSEVEIRAHDGVIEAYRANPYVDIPRDELLARVAALQVRRS